jgi:hypothetical protein
LQGRYHLEDLNLDGRIIFLILSFHLGLGLPSGILKKQEGKVWTGFIWLRIGLWRALVCTVMKLKVQKRKRIGYLSNYQSFKNSAAWS